MIEKIEKVKRDNAGTWWDMIEIIELFHILINKQPNFKEWR